MPHDTSSMRKRAQHDKYEKTSTNDKYEKTVAQIIRAEKVNAYYLYIGQIKTSSSVDRSHDCSESFDRHMRHNSRFATDMGCALCPTHGRYAPPFSMRKQEQMTSMRKRAQMTSMRKQEK